jgi:hypothetical protein
VRIKIDTLQIIGESFGSKPFCNHTVLSNGRRDVQMCPFPIALLALSCMNGVEIGFKNLMSQTLH